MSVSRISSVTPVLTRSVRRLATTARETGESITEKSFQSQGKDGQMMTTLTKVRTSWQKMSWWQKYGGLMYLTGGLSYAGMRSYNDGKKVLLAHRRRLEQGKTSNFESDWEATLYGCREDSWDHFVGALVWPFTLVRNSVPKLVMALNPNQTPTEIQE